MSTAYVYRAKDQSGALLYIGSTDRVQNRIGYHRRYAGWWTPDVRFSTEEHPALAAAREAEARAIRSEFPRWNIEGRSPEHPDGPARSGYDVVLMGYPWRQTPHFNPHRSCKRHLMIGVAS